METNSMVTIGVDLGDRKSHVTVLDRAGEVSERLSLATRREAFCEVFADRSAARVVLEASTPSRWVAALLEGLGHEVLVANPRRLGLRQEGEPHRRGAQQGRASVDPGDLRQPGEQPPNASSG